MASPSHKFGQIIGDLLEAAIEPCLASFATEQGLYLDKKGRRAARGTAMKVRWRDNNGNTHDLDFVLERDGTDAERGQPVAFIESAWRRYTRHSRNKAQEIQGAIEPLADTYKHVSPFKGAVLAGEFTHGALAQLQSLGFSILYFPYSAIRAAFQSVGFDAAFDEQTPDDVLRAKIAEWRRLPAETRDLVPTAIRRSDEQGVREFLESMRKVTGRQLVDVKVLPLHGVTVVLDSVQAAIEVILMYAENNPPSRLERYEVELRYSNGSSIRGAFVTRNEAIAFLRAYLPLPS